MKILMIGGNGFLGSHIKKELCNYNIYSPSKKEVNWATRDGIDNLKNYNPDVVIHLLAIYGGLPFCLQNRVRMGIENLEINANVYRYIIDCKPKKIITMGSGCEYPGYRTGCLKESDLGDGKLHFSVEHYGYTKLIQLELCKALNEEYGVEFEHIVLANMYGPGDIFDDNRSHVVGALIYKFVKALKENSSVQLLGTGRSIRDLVYVKDVAKMVRLLLEREKSTNQPLNASTGLGTTIKELAESIASILDFKNLILWGDESQDGSLIKFLSNDKTRDILNWSPETKLKDGLKETIQWYLSHGF